MKHASITRATVANISVEGMALKVKEHNEVYPTLPINTTIHATMGVSAWGTESGATVETTAEWNVFALFIREVLQDLGEEAAYITENGARAFILWSDGRLEDL